MHKINNKGQSLVLFVLLLPIMIGIMALVIDIGNAMMMKNKTDNVIEMVIDIALNKELERNEIEDLINYNLKSNKNNINISENRITIQSSTKVEGIFSKLFGFSGFSIESEYIGEIQNEKKLTKKIK